MSLLQLVGAVEDTLIVFEYVDIDVTLPDDTFNDTLPNAAQIPLDTAHSDVFTWLKLKAFVNIHVRAYS